MGSTIRHKWAQLENNVHFGRISNNFKHTAVQRYTSGFDCGSFLPQLELRVRVSWVFRTRSSQTSRTRAKAAASNTRQHRCLRKRWNKTKAFANLCDDRHIATLKKGNDILLQHSVTVFISKRWIHWETGTWEFDTWSSRCEDWSLLSTSNKTDD